MERTENTRITIKEAIVGKIKYFDRVKPCIECGGHAHWMEKWALKSCLCVNCCPESDGGMSLGELMKGSKGRIAEQEKMIRRNYTIGRAFSGYSTI